MDKIIEILKQLKDLQGIKEAHEQRYRVLTVQRRSLPSDKIRNTFEIAKAAMLRDPMPTCVAAYRENRARLDDLTAEAARLHLAREAVRNEITKIETELYRLNGSLLKRVADGKWQSEANDVTIAP